MIGAEAKNLCRTTYVQAFFRFTVTILHGQIVTERGTVFTKRSAIFEFAAILVICFALAGCSAGAPTEVSNETAPAIEEVAANYVRSNPSAIGFSLEDAAESIPFSSYTYDFTAYENNFMITVTPDETRTGLVLTLEDNNFGFSNFNVYPPEGYAVYIPYSQNDASTVCTVIHGSENDAILPDEGVLPDILKIDFYLISAENENLPYVVSRMYSVLNGRLTEIKVYGPPDESVYNDSEKALKSSMFLWSYIPESTLYHTEPHKFMAEPKVTANDNGSFDVSIITYIFDPDDMTMVYSEEDCSIENPLYFGYSAYAVAGNIYKYFRDTSFNVSDYENYVEIAAANSNSSQYFFKVDDPRFSTVQELREFAEKYFSKDIVDEMFLSAPQQYRDIDSTLYSIVGDGGRDNTLGKIIFTGEMEEPIESETRTITYYTKQEKFNENHEMTGYIDGGNFTVELTDSEPGFLITQYRYPY